MKDIMKKLSELEATAPKVSKKKMLNEDSTTPPMNVSNKPASLKDVFESMASQKPIPVVGKQGDTQQTGAGFLNVTDNSPAAQALGNALSDLASQKKVQIVMPTQGQPAPAGATGQPQAGQQQMKEKWDAETKVAPSEKGKYAGKDKAELTKAYNKLKASGPHKKGSPEFGKMRELAFAIRAKSGWGKVQEEEEHDYSDYEERNMLDDLYDMDLPKPGDSVTIDGRHGIVKSEVNQDTYGGPAEFEVKYDDGTVRLHSVDTILNGDSSYDEDFIDEGAKVDRMVKHIEKSERKLGKSKDEAENIAWATANKRGMLDNKNKKKVKEADIPSTNGIDTMGAGLGAGRSATTLEGKKPDFLDLDKDGNKKESMKKAAADKKKQKVKESMNHRISAARLEGKSHGLRGHAHSGKRYEDIEEMRAYHEGYKEGMDELYEMGMYETAMPATIPGMADAAMDEGIKDNLKKAGMAAALGATALAGGAMAKKAYDYHKTDPAMGMSQSGLDQMTGKDYSGRNRVATSLQAAQSESAFDEGNAFTAALAKTPKGGKFSVGGKTFTDRTGYDAKIDEYAFESLDKQLNSLLNESEEVTEGLSVSVSKGQQNSPDSVTITAQDAEADQLLQLVKHAGLGLFGDDHAHEPSSAMSLQPASGAPDEVGAGGVDIDVVDGHDGMMGLMQKLTGIQDHGDEEDYADEEDGCDCEEGNCDCDKEEANEQTCNECGGMMEAGHSCGSKEMVDEVESEDQMEFEVSEDNAPDSDEAETSADEEAEADEDKALALKSMNESSFFDLLDRLDQLAEGSGDKPKHPEHDKKDDKDYDDAEEEVNEAAEEDEEDAIEESEDLTEWANQVGKGPGKGTDASFEQDIDFMTKVIAGGLNKPKSTGQTTVPVIAGQTERMHDHQGTVSDSIDDWVKLAGVK